MRTESSNGSEGTSAPPRKAITVVVDPADLEYLKGHGFSLRLARKVALGGASGTYDVVWQSSNAYLENNVFPFTEDYALFACGPFTDAAGISPRTDMQSLALGAECTLEPTGALSFPRPGPAAAGLTVINDYGPIHACLAEYLSLGDQGWYAPLYVTEAPLPPGATTLTPLDAVLVWFEQNLAASTMFAAERPASVEVDLTGAGIANVHFSGGRWAAGPLRATASRPGPDLAGSARRTGGRRGSEPLPAAPR